MSTIDAVSPRVVSRAEWLELRKTLLSKEKEYTRLGDRLSAEKRELPWVKVEKEYFFDGPKGKESLANLFGNKTQLLVYHFMFGPDWEQGCPTCSLVADNIDPNVIHLEHRDVALVVVSRAPVVKIEAFKKRMGWHFTWVSSFASDFNYDYGVSFTAETAKGKLYNYGTSDFPSEEAPGISVFTKDSAGAIFHTYSSYARGPEFLVGAYNYLDLVPKGRNETGLPYTMAWVRHHDQYQD
ncbi:MAG: DUF899 domain-containing protein [Verrucomicrobia bacterium]|nr:DUF899 domain-containing protein [Verrucomicrobiota bacterium]MBV8278089.1 DUF899 domain-containing protein [Verrucomicrobiota bacterium]